MLITFVLIIMICCHDYFLLINVKSNLYLISMSVAATELFMWLLHE